MATYLPSAEKPGGVIMKMQHWFRRRVWGKAPSGTEVFAARMPRGFLRFYNETYSLDQKLRVPPETAMLVRQQVASTNGCFARMDTGSRFAMKGSASCAARFDALWEYHTDPRFSDAERAALDYATELTVYKTVSQVTFARLARHYTGREICDIVWLVASEHLANMTHVGLNIEPDVLYELRPKRSTDALSPWSSLMADDTA